MKMGIWFNIRWGMERAKVAAKASVAMKWLWLKVRVGTSGFIIHFLNSCIQKFL